MWLTGYASQWATTPDRVGVMPSTEWILRPYRVRDLDLAMKVNRELREAIEPVAGAGLADRCAAIVAKEFGPIFSREEDIQA